MYIYLLLLLLMYIYLDTTGDVVEITIHPAPNIIIVIGPGKGYYGTFFLRHGCFLCSSLEGQHLHTQRRVSLKVGNGKEVAIFSCSFFSCRTDGRGLAECDSIPSNNGKEMLQWAPRSEWMNISAWPLRRRQQ